MILPLTQEIITTGFFSKLTNIRSLRCNLKCGYEFKSSYKSCGYSSTHGIKRFIQLRRMAANSRRSHSTGFSYENLWLLKSFANRQRPQYIMVNHISHIQLIIIFSSRRKTTLNPYSISRLEFRAARSTHKGCTQSKDNSNDQRKLIIITISSRLIKRGTPSRKRQRPYSLQPHNLRKIRGISSINPHYSTDHSTLLAGKY